MLRPVPGFGVNLLREHRTQPGNLVVALGKAVPQMPLLPLELGFNGRKLVLKLPHALKIGAIRRAHQVRQHVHVAKCRLHHLVAGVGMGQHRPVGARNVAAADGLFPKHADCRVVLGLGEPVERDLVAPVERLLQKLAALLRPVGQ